MIQYVEKLFQETKTIILPGLGALTITNPDTKELMFMPFLKHDDGALAGFIEKEAGISNDEAKKMVSDEIHLMLNDLEGGKTVTFGHFGCFKKGADGDMEFENSESDDNSPPTAPSAIPSDNGNIEEKKQAEEEVRKKEEKEAEEKKHAEEETRKKEEKEAEEKKRAEEEARKKEEKEAEEKKRAEEETRKKEEKEAEEKRNNVITPLTPVANTSKTSRATVNEVIPDTPNSSKDYSGKNILQKEEIAANQKKLNDLKKQQESKEEKKKRGVGFYILIALLVLIVAGGTLVALNYEKAKEYLPFLGDETAVASTGDEEMDKMDALVGDNEEEESVDEEVSEEEEIDTDEVSEEEVEEEIPAEEEQVQEPEPTAPNPAPAVPGTNNQPFHIVAGVFSEAANAERLAEKIRDMGYPAKTFPKGAQTVVSVQSFATASEAQAALSSVKDAAPSGWVLEWR